MDHPAENTQSEKETIRPTSPMPLIRDFNVKIRPLDAGQDLARAFSEVATRAVGMKATSIQFSIVREGTPHDWVVAVTPKGSKARPGRAPKPSVEIIIEESAWWDIAEGRLAPLEVFGRGKVRVRGSLERARELFNRLKG